MSRHLLLVLALCGCATARESAVRDRFASHPPPRRAAAADLDGTLGRYVAHALETHPEMQASYHRWEAATEGIDRARRLPDPMVSYTAFIQRVETRVGPQRHRIGLRQDLPWPTQLTHGAEAASLEAESAGRRVDAVALTLTARVADAYWELWRVRQSRRVLRDQASILEALAEAARARMEVGTAGLADVSQIGLTQSRNADAIAGLGEEERRAAATLSAALGHTLDEVSIEEDPPVVALPRPSREALREAAADHPAIDAIALAAASRVERADQVFAESLPMLSLGFDWIEVGEAVMPDVPDSGKDAVSVTVGLSIPLWRFAESATEAAARAESRALYAERDALVLARQAEVDVVLTRIRDAVRRVRLYRDTLLPQAETVLEATLAGYQIGEVPLASVLIAQRELLEIQLGRFEAQASHAKAWAVLEHLVGEKVPAGEEA